MEGRRVKPYYQDAAVTIYLGESREVMAGLDPVDAIVTDPPYGETDLAWDTWPEGWPSIARRLTASLWCFGSMRMFRDHFGDFAKWKLAQDIVWEKQNGTGMHNDRFRRVHELALHFYHGKWGAVWKCPQRQPAPESRKRGSLLRQTKPQHWGGVSSGRYEYGVTRLQRSVIACKNMHRRAQSPTEKPPGIVRPLVLYSVPPGGVLLDPFCASGAVLRVAKDHGRRAIGIDQSERECELAAKRCAQEALPLS